MSYQKYTTDALVIGSTPRGEADKTLLLYTRDFGFVRAIAKGMRKERSRLRPALQELSLVRVSLVSGKGGWRVAGASLHRAPARFDSRGSFALARILTLVQKMVQGEERNEYLYDSLAGAHRTLLCGEAAADEAETLCVARLLFSLGYVAPEQEDAFMFEHCAYDDAALLHTRTRRQELIRVINASFAESQLVAS